MSSFICGPQAICVGVSFSDIDFSLQKDVTMTEVEYCSSTQKISSSITDDLKKKNTCVMSPPANIFLYRNKQVMFAPGVNLQKKN